MNFWNILSLYRVSEIAEIQEQIVFKTALSLFPILCPRRNLTAKLAELDWRKPDYYFLVLGYHPYTEPTPIVPSGRSKGRGSPLLIYLSLSYLFIYAGTADSLYWIFNPSPPRLALHPNWFCWCTMDAVRCCEGTNLKESCPSKQEKTKANSD